MPTSRTLAAALVAGSVLLGACGDGEPAAVTTTTTEPGTTTTTEGEILEQPAVWPEAGVVFETPEEAAADFVEAALGVPPQLGEFRRGDARSGEIDLLSRGEDGGEEIVRGTLLLRQFGPGDGWFVIAAVNDNAAIATPDAGAEVEAGELTVAGEARGFEGTVVVTAFPTGRADAELDRAVVQGGAMEEPEPYTATLDLSGAEPGEVLAVLVRGGTGLETDPGELAAVPVVVGQ